MAAMTMEQKLFWAESMNEGLVRVMTDITIQQVQASEQSAEVALMHALATIDQSIESLTAFGTSEEGRTDVSASLRTMMRIFMKPLEENARAKLGLPPQSQSSN